jgi:hypothetical protein
MTPVPEKSPLQKARDAVQNMRALMREAGWRPPAAAPILGNNEQPREANMPTDKTTLANRLRAHAAEYAKVATRAKGIGPMVDDLRAAADALEAAVEAPPAPEPVVADPVESTGEQVLFPSEITKPKAEKA